MLRVKAYFQPSDLCIRIEGEDGARLLVVDLEPLKDCAHVLELIFEMRREHRGGPEGTGLMIAAFMGALDEACQKVFGLPADVVYCSIGMDHVVDWRSRTTIRKNLLLFQPKV